MIKACIFDLDGTLTNTLDSLEYSVNETMKEIGMPQITKEQCRQFIGDGAKVLLERTLKAGGDTQLCHLEEAVEAYARIFDANCMYKVAPYEGIPQMLQQLKESGIKLATGHAARMQTILVSWGFRGREALLEGGAECIVDSAEEIRKIVKKQEEK